MAGRLSGKRILITEADTFMGPAMHEGLEAAGARVVADGRRLVSSKLANDVISDAGEIDGLLVNLAGINPRKQVIETTDEAWKAMFDTMVHPMHWIVRAALPQMLKRKKGKVVVVGSASGLRAQPEWSSYATARAAQLTYVKFAAIEAAPHNVQVNAIAQTFVENPVYFSPEYIQTEEFQGRLKQVPLGRLAKPEEDALLATYLLSDESDFIVGQVISFSGGWQM
jgi:NAD(P)-dependent dehydrogenase (short-subunit alcohol dehydrogenase family)